ncbi:Gfo/Idh/MocA family oxidoreductase [Acidothermaceae bacterium B102]|nr:Gfo/Idh/MocA family oxidoreductase [Acidothermaceae bacterium B102]
MTDKLRVAVVGTGEWWGREHARVFSVRDDTELVAVVGRTPEKTQRRAQEFRTTPYTNLATMLEAEQPDLVSLCLPNESHFDTTLEVIRAGVPLLVEKPLVFEPWQAAYLLAEAAKRDLFFALNFNHRYAVPVQMAAQAIRAGELGELVFATWRFGGEPGTSQHPWANLIETQCHGFDMLEHLLGPIATVSAEVNDLTGHGFSTVAVALSFAGGAIGTMLGTYDSSYAYPRAHMLEVNGTEGRLLIDDTVRRFTQSRTGDATARVWEAGLFDDRGRDFGAMFEAHLDELVPALRAGGPPPIHAAAGSRALDVATAVIQSARERRHVAVPAPS